MLCQGILWMRKSPNNIEKATGCALKHAEEEELRRRYQSQAVPAVPPGANPARPFYDSRSRPM